MNDTITVKYIDGRKYKSNDIDGWTSTYRRIKTNLKKRCAKFAQSRGIDLKFEAKDIGIGKNQLKEYLKSTMTEDMNFFNYGTVWTLDHIVAISSARTVEEFKKMNYYTNFQALYKEENFKKGNK